MDYVEKERDSSSDDREAARPTDFNTLHSGRWENAHPKADDDLHFDERENDPASATQNQPPNGQMQAPQAGRVPQQVAQPGLVQHLQHTANPQLAAYLHGQPPQPHQPRGQPGGGQPAQPHQGSYNLLAYLPVPYRNHLLQQKVQFPQLEPAEKQAWLDKWTDPQLKNLPDWPSKTDDEKANLALQWKARQVIYQHRMAYGMQRIAGQVGIGQVGQGAMANGMMANGMMENGMMENGWMENGVMENGADTGGESDGGDG